MVGIVVVIRIEILGVIILTRTLVRIVSVINDIDSSRNDNKNAYRKAFNHNYGDSDSDRDRDSDRDGGGIKGGEVMERKQYD